MSVTMDDSIKRWTAKRKTALVVEIIQGKTTVAEEVVPMISHPRRSRVGSRTRSGAWRMRCGRIRWRSASNTRSS